MAKAFVLAEKPSVAREIVAALGTRGLTSSELSSHAIADGSAQHPQRFRKISSHRAGAFWESESFIVGHALGHLLEFLEPEEINPEWRRWSLSSLPIRPPKFLRRPVSGQAELLQSLCEEMRREDVVVFINACDAAREGELIFREIYTHCGVKKPVKRLWLQAMTSDAILRAFENLRSGASVDGLGAAAECRARSDWLIGMNATRAFSLQLGRRLGEAPWSIGRVQTPTLALLVRREREILAHQAENYWKIKARFQALGKDGAMHAYDAYWAKADAVPEAKPELNRAQQPDGRLKSKKDLEALLASFRKAETASAKAIDEVEKVVRPAPPLFHLTSLQKQMATRFKWSAKKTLEVAQKLYEQHKVITYPRTGSDCLPSGYEAEVKRVIKALASHSPYTPFAQELRERGLNNRHRNFNDDGVDDHFAMIPTGRVAALGGDEERLFDVIARRFFAAFYPPAEIERLKRTTIFAEHLFRSEPVDHITFASWMGVVDQKNQDRKPPEHAGKGARELLKPFPLMNPKGEKALLVKLEEIQDATKPPPRISEGQLLNLMEQAGKALQDDEKRTALQRARGLGTPATRAEIIQNLKQKNYIDPAFRPSPKAMILIDVLERLREERLTSAEFTAELELDLYRIEASKDDWRGATISFQKRIEDYVGQVVASAKRWQESGEGAIHNDAHIALCPQCKSHAYEKNVYERPFHYQCEACHFRIEKDCFGRFVDINLARELCIQGETKVSDGFNVEGAKQNVAGFLQLKAGRVTLCVLGDQGKLRSYDLVEMNKKRIRIPDALCGRRLNEKERAQLLSGGRTQFLNGFLSKNGKEFGASLYLQDDGRIGFDFANPRSVEFEKD